jgi:CRP/FNR family transcriptional regulator, anaerobic regulatory protein
MYAHAMTSELDLRRPATATPSFAPSPSGGIADRFSAAPARTLQAREHLYREDDPLAQVYLVVAGAFLLYRLLPDGRRQVTGFASKGDLLGLGALARHHASAEACGLAKVRALPASTLHHAAQADPEFGLRLYQAISRELASAQELLLTLGRCDAGQRVATFLHGASEANGVAGRSRGLIELPMTRCDIGDYLGLTTETVSRTLTKLVNRRIIAREGGAIRVLDAGALEDIAHGDQAL